MTDLERLQQLRGWMRGLGACYHCALTYALTAVEREAGREFKPEPARHYVAATGWSKGACEQLIRAQWKERPARKKEAA
jgi:hypothetical protein